MPDTQPYDLLIIGGGINGAGIARDAAGRGLSVALCEQNDFASATSSASSKLIHGGLRYLEYYEFRLVREALNERELLLRNAPHIIWPLRFVLPHNKAQRPAWMIRLGLFLYDNLGRRTTLKGTTTLDLRRDPQGAPLNDTVVKGFEYSDCWVEDSRLVILNVMDAAERGADIFSRTRCRRARRDGAMWSAELEDTLTGDVKEVRARLLVNAGGPWVHSVIQGVLGRNEPSRVKLIKGSHLIVPRLHDGPEAYILQNTDKRIVFVIPYENRFSLIGTTDLEYDGDPSSVAIDAEETQYLCDIVNMYFRRQISPKDVIRTYSGVRPLYDDSHNNPSAITRDYVFDVEDEDGRAPLLSIYGGKITTYRQLALHAIQKIGAYFDGLKPAWTDQAPLPGGDMPGADFDAFLARLKQDFPWLDGKLAYRYARLYGTRAYTLLDGATGPQSLGEDFSGGLTEREATYLMSHEWAHTVEDITWRRTKLALHMDNEGLTRFQAWLESRQPHDRRRTASSV